MPFIKVDIDKEIEKRMEEDVEFKKEYLEITKEYELIKQIAEIRKEVGLTQSEIAKETGMKQQVVSRMEKLGSSPSLRNFLKYIDAIGLDIKITKKS